jgi:hypothetical protein
MRIPKPIWIFSLFLCLGVGTAEAYEYNHDQYVPRVQEFLPNPPQVPPAQTISPISPTPLQAPIVAPAPTVSLPATAPGPVYAPLADTFRPNPPAPRPAPIVGTPPTAPRAVTFIPNPPEAPRATEFRPN